MSPSRIAACLSLLAVPLAACSGGPSNNSQESAGGMSMTAAAPHSCVFQTRLVTHCNGETDGLWVSRCDDGPCPATLPDDASEFPNIEGGWLCVSLYENRNVVDIAGTCAEWTSAGFPDTPPDHIYCGASLLYNQYDEGTADYGACTACEQASCAAAQSACDANCGALINCMRACTPGDVAAENSCAQKYPQSAGPANAYVACVVDSCGGICT